MKKIVISFLFLLTFLLSYSTYASSFKFSATPEVKSVKPGDEVAISLKISDIDAGNEGINVVETTLEYDKNYIDSVEFIDKNDWKSEYNPNQGNLFGKLLYSKMVTGVKSDEEIGVLKFKIKDNVNEFETQIKLKNVTSNDGYNLIDDGTKTITLIYKSVLPDPTPISPEDPQSEPEKDPDTEPEKEPDEDSDKDPTKESDKTQDKDSDKKADNEKNPKQDKEPNKSEKIENKKDETSKQEKNKLPQNVQTGDIIGIIVGILLLAIILSIVLFIINKHNKNERK